jgi:hypothetical protein
MRRRSFGLEWLDRNNRKQQQWSHAYLLKKGVIEQSDEPVTYETLMQVSKGLERSNDGRVTIQKMRNAWRQVEYRAPEKGRKACTFKLKAEVKRELASLAKKNDTNETDMLSILISEGASAHAGLKQQLAELKEKAKKLKLSNDTAMELLEFTVATLCRTEVLLHDAIPTVAITPNQERRIDVIRKQVWRDANADIADSADATGEIQLRISGRIYQSMRGEERANRRVARKTAENSNTKAQLRFANLQPVTYSKLPSQRHSEPTSTAATTVTNPSPNPPVADSLGMESNDNALLHYKNETPPQPRRAPTLDRSIWLQAKTELGPQP